MGQQVGREVLTVPGVSGSCGATPFTWDPQRAQLQVEHPGEVDQGRLADGAGGHPGRRLQARAGSHVHDRTRTAVPRVRDTAWFSHNAAPRLTSIMSRRSPGVAVSASPRPYVPVVFTSTSGGPTSAAIRSTTLPAAAGSAGLATSRRMLSGSSFSAPSFRSTPAIVNPAAGSFSAVARPSSPPAPATCSLMPPPPWKRRRERMT